MTDQSSSLIVSHQSNAPSPWQLISWFLLLLFSLAPMAGAKPTRLIVAQSDSVSISQDATTVQPLEVSKPVESVLHSGEVHSYQVTTVSDDQYFLVVVEQHDIDVVVTLVGPDGKKLSEVDYTKAAMEWLPFVAERAGSYRVEVSPTEKDAKAGRYEASLAALRIPTAEDRGMVEALQLIRQTRQLAAEGKLDEALPLAQRALTLRESALGPNHYQVAQTLSLVARVLDFKGEPAQGEPLYRRALVIAERELGPEHFDVSVILNDLANLLNLKGDFAQSTQLYQRALAIREKQLGPDHSSLAVLIYNLASVLTEEGDYTQAELFHQRALALREKHFGPDHLNVASSLNGLGLVYKERGDYAQADLMFRRALSILEKSLGPDHPNVALLIHNIAGVAELAGDDARAEPLFQQALAKWEKRLGAEHPQVALSLNRLAGLYEKRGEYAKAEPLYLRALAIREKAFGPDNPDVGTTLKELGWLYFKRGQAGDLARAKSFTQRAVGILERALGDHPKVAQALDNLAKISQAENDIEHALSFSSRASDIREHNLSTNLMIGSERQKLGYLKLFAGDIDNALTLHTQTAPRDPRALLLAFNTLLRRKGRGLDAMSDSIGTLRGRADKKDQALFAELFDARSRLATLTFRGPGQDVRSYKSQITGIEADVDRLEGALSVRSAEFRAQSQPITLETVQAAIPEGAALVEFVLLHPSDAKSTRDISPRYTAYVLPSRGAAQWADLGEANVIDGEVKAWRQALSDPQRADVKQLGRALDEKVMRPVRKLLGPARHLLISPDGPLNLVPFAALVDEQNNYLLERYDISYLTSGRDLLRLKIPRESKSPPVVVADPSFGDPATLVASAADRGTNTRLSGKNDGPSQVDYSQIFFGPLPGVRNEVRALKQLLPNATFFTGPEATKIALRNVSGPRILHIATHGFFLQDSQNIENTALIASRSRDETRLGKWVAHVENPLLRSGLALAGANRPDISGDGVLTALEATGLDLWGTKLVVLSACDTGLGEVKNGDGVYGLRRALVLAGSETQIMSLWQVSDRSTRDLMVGYYTALIRGEGRSEAIREVQLRMLRTRVQRHPYYWASFIQSGEWANLEGSR